MRGSGKTAIATLTLCMLTAGLLVILANSSYAVDARAVQSRSAILQALGIDSLAVLIECNSTRRPIEGICACLSDVPGGYCYHTDCDLLGRPKVQPEEVFQLAITRGRRDE